MKSVTEHYPGAGSDLFTGLNIDGVNRINFSTTDTFGYLDPNKGNPIVAGTFTSPRGVCRSAQGRQFHGGAGD